MPIPDFDDHGDLPIGVHRASREEVLARFGKDTPQREIVSARLSRIYDLAKATGKLARFIIFAVTLPQSPIQTTLTSFS